MLQICASAQSEQGGPPAVHAASNCRLVQMRCQIWVSSLQMNQQSITLLSPVAVCTALG